MYEVVYKLLHDWTTRRHAPADVFFFKKSFSDFFTLWVSVNTCDMTFSTILSYNPTDKVPAGSVVHTESLWTLIVTSISLTPFGDLNFVTNQGLSQFWTYIDGFGL